MRIVILGGLGNYRLTLAGLATGKGHNVLLLQFPGTIRRIPVMPQKNYEPLIRNFENQGGLFEIDDKLTGRKTEYNLPHKVLRSAEEIPEDVGILVIAYPSLLHENIGRMLRGCLNNKVIITFTDRFLGGYSILNNADALSATQLIAVNATPVTAFQDNRNPFKRLLYSNKWKIKVACYPNDHADELMKILQNIVPGNYNCADNLLELAFNCTPSNLHAPHDLLNIVRYEQAHDFTMFHEGFTQGVENLIHGVSKERCAIAQAFGIQSVSYLEYEQTTYNYHGNSVIENRRLNPQLNKIPAPTSLYSCKGIEDVVCALVPLSELARLASIQTPIINALIELWSCYLGADLKKEGRTLTSLGLIGKSINEIKHAVNGASKKQKISR